MLLIPAPMYSKDVLIPRTLSRAFPTSVYFGDTHVHTALSLDAGIIGTRLMPRDAYRFARGEQVLSNMGQPAKLSRPLDFFMITDHFDGMGGEIHLGTRRIEVPLNNVRYTTDY